MVDDGLSKKLPVWVSGMPWPQTFDYKGKLRVGGIGSAQSYTRTPRQKLVDYLNRSFYGANREGQDRAENIVKYLDLTPLAVPNAAYDATRALGEGRYTDAIVPGITATAPFLAKPVKTIAEAVKRRGFSNAAINGAERSPATEPAVTNVLEAKITKTGEPAFKPTFVKPPVLTPTVQKRLVDPYDIDFRVPRNPAKRSSPWVAQYPPILRPPREFRLDYPNGAPADADGFLKYDMEMRPLTAKYIAGRRQVNKPDYALAPDEISSLIHNDAGVWIAPARKSQLTPGTIGQFGRYPDGQAEINFWDELPGDQADVTIAHELGHLLDEIAGRISTKEIDDELIPLYSAHSKGRIGPPFLLPENRGYRNHHPPREKAAEAFRIYTTGPNTMKSMAPKAAAALRTLNSHPFFSKFLQFNGAPIGVPTGAAAMAAALGTMGRSDESNAAEVLRRRNSQTNLGSNPTPGTSQAPSNKKFNSLVRALVDLEGRQKSRLYGGPR